jgi:hypothetical protein
MSFGSSRWTWYGRRIDTFGIHIPGWLIQVSAPGYSTSDLIFLDTPEHQRLVKRGEGIARLEIRTKLLKTTGVGGTNRHDP